MLKHDNIMKLHHIEDQDNFTFIVSEIYEGGSLKEYLDKKGKLKLKFRQIYWAISYGVLQKNYPSILRRRLSKYHSSRPEADKYFTH